MNFETENFLRKGTRHYLFAPGPHMKFIGPWKAICDGPIWKIISYQLNESQTAY